MLSIKECTLLICILCPPPQKENHTTSSRALLKKNLSIKYLRNDAPKHYKIFKISAKESGKTTLKQ